MGNMMEHLILHELQAQKQLQLEYMFWSLNMQMIRYTNQQCMIPPDKHPLYGCLLRVYRQVEGGEAREQMKKELFRWGLLNEQGEE